MSVEAHARIALALAVSLLATCGGCRAPHAGATAGGGSTVTPPPPSVTTDLPMIFFVYRMQAGDTLFSLGRRFQVPWQVLMADNKIERAEDIRTGRLLFVRRAPGVEPPPLGARLDESDAPRRAVEKADLHRGHPRSAFWWPTRGEVVWRYGDQLRGLEEPGMGLSAPAGTEVCAAAAGRVIVSRPAAPDAPPVWGSVVALQHRDGMVTWYAHLGRILVSEGDWVAQGTPIATAGASGAAAQSGLAFRIFRNHRPVNPAAFLP
jgi:murein DD-endopeptidase MepM/ murein hydrolase activator NlpD